MRGANATVRPTNAGGMFGSSQLQGAAGLTLVWRMRIYSREKTVGAAKALWYLRGPLSLAANEYKRIV